MSAPTSNRNGRSSTSSSSSSDLSSQNGTPPAALVEIDEDRNTRNASNVPPPVNASSVETNNEDTSPTSPTTSNQQIQHTRDPFLFYSNPENLRRARAFEVALGDGGSDEDPFRGENTVRRTRISFERDAFSLLSDILLEEED